MRCLVTGGTGYIGTYVVRDLLKAGKEVVCFQRSGITPTFRKIVGEDNINRVKIIQGDQSNTLQLFNVIREQGIDVIVALGSAMKPLTEEQPAYALQVNCVAFNSMLEAVRLFGLKRILWASSCHALGPVHDLYKEPIGDDNAIYRPPTMYGATKAFNEFMARIYFSKFGVDSIGFRLPLCYGAGMSGLTEFFRKAALNIPVTIGNASVLNQVVYVEDLSAAIANACDVPTTRTRVFNIVEGHYTWRQIADTISNINPEAQVTVEEGAEQGLFLPKVDGTGLRSELGWQPKYSLEEGLRTVLNDFRRKEGMVPL
jgi:UDP-glucose 4-epimerase